MRLAVLSLMFGVGSLTAGCSTSHGGGCVDDDRDGICESEDNCPDAWNPGQADCDDNDIGDVCDADVAPECLVLSGDIVSVGGESSSPDYVLRGGGGSVHSGDSENAEFRLSGGVTAAAGP